MDLLDQFGQSRQIKISQQLQKQRMSYKHDYQYQPPLLKYMKRRIQNILPRLLVHIIQNPCNIGIQHNFERFFYLIFQDKVLYRQKYQYWTQFLFNQQCNSVSIRHYLTLNSIKIKANGSLNIKISLKLCSKLNQIFNSFKINFQPLSGNVQLSNNFTITQKEMTLITKFQKGSDHLIQVILDSIQNGFKYLDLILLICGQISLKQILKNQRIQNQFYFLKEAFQIIQNLEKELFKIHFFKPKQIETQSQTGFFDNLDAIRNIQYFSQNMEQILSMFIQTKNSMYFEDKNIYSRIQQEDQNRHFDSETKSNYIRKCILTQINIQDQSKNIKWQPVCQGGFGIIEAAVVNFRDLTSSCKQYDIKKEILVKKSDKFQNKRKLIRQKQTLKLLEFKRSPNILNFFYSTQKQFSEYLFSQYSPNLSLDFYIQKSKKSMSVEKSLYFMIQLAKGIHFLHSHQIIHLDLKPGNIIITKNLRLTISDFGQAFVTSNNPNQHLHAYTVPYCAPQIFQPNFYYQTDIYALGVIIFHCILQKSLWMFIDKQKFLTKLKNQCLTKTLFLEQSQNEILQKFQKIIYFLVIKCTDQNHLLRPKIQWILFILMQLAKFIHILSE